MTEKTIVAIDPSMTSTGWARASTSPDVNDRYVRDAGRIRLGSKDSVALRCERLFVEISDILEDAIPSVVVVEGTSGKVNRRRHGGGGSGLAIYGMAIGVAWAAAHASAWTPRVALVKENKWTGGRSKDDRRRIAAKNFPDLEDITDPGDDVSDAIAIACWWLAEREGKLV